MTDITGLGRGGAGAVRAGWFGWRVLNQRRWFWYVRYQAVVRALMLREEDPVPAAVNEAATRLCEILDTLLVPMEPRTGVVNRLTRWIREKITHGIRYPRHTGPDRATYWDRLYRWVRQAAETDEGRTALDHAGFPESEDRSHRFALRVVAKTSGLLLDNALPEAVNRIRDEMATQVNQGTSSSRMSDTHRRLQVAARTITAGAASTFVTYVGFDQDLSSSLGMGGVALASTAVADIANGGFGGITEQMQAARRQTRDWLATMSLWLIQYVTWREEALREERGTGVQQLIGILTALAGGEAKLERVPDDERVRSHLQHLIEAANRVGDGDLHTALMNLEGAVMFRPAYIPHALAALITLVEGVPDLLGPDSPTNLPPPGQVPNQLRHQASPEDLEPWRRG